MWAFIVRKLLYNIPVYLSIILLLMLALRVQDPVRGYLGKSVTQEQIDAKREEMGLADPDLPFHRRALHCVVHEYPRYLGQIFTLDFEEESWQQKGRPVRDVLVKAIPVSMAITIPSLLASAGISVVIGLISAFFRGRLPDKLLVFFAVIGMSISYLVYIIFGQFFGAFWPFHAGWETQPFAIQGYEPLLASGDPLGSWVKYCMLPVIIGVIVSMGYDTRFYRAVMVEESNRDYIVTATAKGASRRKVMFVHMLKNAMIPIITRIMATLPFLITGSILLEMYFNLPGMGRQLILALQVKDFPVIQAFVAVIGALFLLSIILTDVLYALVDPRVRLQ